METLSRLSLVITLISLLLMLGLTITMLCLDIHSLPSRMHENRQELWRLMLIQEDQQETLAALKKRVQKEDINMRKHHIREQFRELLNKQVSGLVSQVYSPQPVYKDQHRPSEGDQVIN